MVEKGIRCGMLCYSLICEIQSRSLVKTIHWYEHRTVRKNAKKMQNKKTKKINHADFGKTMENAR